MTSLTEVYEGHVGPVASARRLYLGAGLFFAGVALVLIAIVLAATEVLSVVGIDRFQTRRIAGVLGGLGIPAVFVGVFSVMPANQRVRAAAVIGASVSVLGVALFWSFYPYEWVGAGGDHRTLEVVTVYFLGLLTTTWCLFVGIANFKVRNDPGGTVSLEITKEGITRVVEVESDALQGGRGGIGFLGNRPDGEVETQTNTAAVSDGGATTQDITGFDDVDTVDDGEIVSPRRTIDPVDRYCGNCTHFDYVRTREGIQPYCGYRREEMDDMSACEEWAPNVDDASHSH